MLIVLIMGINDLNMARIVQTPTFLTLLGGAPTQLNDVNQMLKVAPILVAADGGADTALAAGHVPAAVIGDMDSISEATRARIPAQALHHIAEQDSTDFAKCLSRIKAGAILALGFAGGRLDHQLAACTTLVNFPDDRVIMIADEDICFLCPEAFEIDLAPGTRVSLFPMAPVQGTSTGLVYPIDGLTLSPGTRVGTSNEATGPVRVQLDRHKMLMILPRDCLALALEALSGSAPTPQGRTM